MRELAVLLSFAVAAGSLGACGGRVDQPSLPRVLFTDVSKDALLPVASKGQGPVGAGDHTVVVELNPPPHTIRRELVIHKR